MSSLIELLDGRGDDVIVYRDGSATTRAELDIAARELADTLAVLGVAGHAVGVSMANIANTVAAWFGIWHAGAAFVPLNPRSPDAERARVVERTGVVAVVTSGAGRGAVRGRTVLTGARACHRRGRRDRAVHVGNHGSAEGGGVATRHCVRVARQRDRVVARRPLRHQGADAEHRADVALALGRHLSSAVRVQARRARRA